MDGRESAQKERFFISLQNQTYLCGDCLIMLQHAEYNITYNDQVWTSFFSTFLQKI